MNIKQKIKEKILSFFVERAERRLRDLRLWQRTRKKECFSIIVICLIG